MDTSDRLSGLPTELLLQCFGHLPLGSLLSSRQVSHYLKAIATEFLHFRVVLDESLEHDPTFEPARCLFCSQSIRVMTLPSQPTWGWILHYMLSAYDDSIKSFGFSNNAGCFDDRCFQTLLYKHARLRYIDLRVLPRILGASACLTTQVSIETLALSGPDCHRPAALRIIRALPNLHSLEISSSALGNRFECFEALDKILPDSLRSLRLQDMDLRRCKPLGIHNLRRLHLIRCDKVENFLGALPVKRLQSFVCTARRAASASFVTGLETFISSIEGLQALVLDMYELEALIRVSCFRKHSASLRLLYLNAKRQPGALRRYTWELLDVCPHIEQLGVDLASLGISRMVSSTDFHYWVERLIDIFVLEGFDWTRASNLRVLRLTGVWTLSEALDIGEAQASLARALHSLQTRTSVKTLCLNAGYSEQDLLGELPPRRAQVVPRLLATQEDQDLEIMPVEAKEMLNFQYSQM